MLDYFVRFFKRFAVLVPGLVVAYLVATDVYPVLNRQVPAPLAVLGAYVFGAYVLVPASMRLIRLVFKNKHIPTYCTTSDGLASDPINIGFFGSREEIIDAMGAANWHAADPRNFRSITKMIWAFITNKTYVTAPFSNLYLFGRKQDLGFQLPVKGSPNSRHHVRFWSSAPRLSEIEKLHISFWQKHVPDFKRKDEKQLWLGAASLDIGLGIIMHNAQLTHTVHPDTNAERDLIIKQLKSAGKIKNQKIIKIGEAYKLRNRVFRSHLKTDGKVVILSL